MESRKKKNLCPTSHQEALDQYDRANRLFKQMLQSPPVYYRTRSWLIEVMKLIYKVYNKQVLNLTVCKIMMNGHVEWCASLDRQKCYCKKMAKSYCCEQWMAGQTQQNDVGKFLYTPEQLIANQPIGVILHMNQVTARAMVIEFKQPGLNDSLIEELELVLSAVTLRLQNFLLQSERDILNAVLREAGDSVELTDTNAVIEFVNPAFEKITGYTLEQAQGKTVAELLRAPEVDSQIFQEIDDTLSQGLTWKGIIQSKRKDGNEWFAQAIIIPIKNLKGEVIKHLAIKQDITQQYYEQKKLKDSESKYRIIMDSAFDGMIIHDLKGNIRQVNRTVCESLGYDEHEILLMHVCDIEVGVDELDLNKIWKLLPTQDYITEGRHRRKNGTVFPIEARLTCITIESENLIIAMIRDISAAKEYEEKLIYKANYDDLTKLPNRSFGLKHLQNTLDEAGKKGMEVTVLFLDLDNFKQVNDSLGHFAGDNLLLNVSRRLKNLIRENDFVARLSGDEFMIVMPQVGNVDTIHSMIERLQITFTQPFHIEGHIIHASASIGVSRYPYDGNTSETLLRHADIAMYQSKSSCRGGWKSFDPDMVQTAIQGMQFENAFRKALTDKDFDIHFQPIIDCSTGELICFEALLRWFHSEYGPVNPAAIIDFSEQIGLAQQLNQWILEEVCRKVQLCEEQYQIPIKVSVNVSPQQINQSNFAKDMQTMLDKFGLNPKQFIIEVTETTLLLGKEEVRKQLNLLKKSGISISIDDFGVGYSSFSHLKDFPFSYLKIDKSFIKFLTNDDSYLNLVKSIITMAHYMNLKVVGEGVETKEQAQILTEINCDYLQGWHISKALPINQLDDWIKSKSS